MGTDPGYEPKASFDSRFFYGSTPAQHARNSRVEYGWLSHGDVVVKPAV